MYTILVVEDDALNREMFVRRLRLERYHVITAIDGHEAIERAQTEHPDLILMDIGLPRLSGLEATIRLKANPTTCHIPIIALTAYVLAEDRQYSEAAGVDGFHTKPVNFAELFTAIRALLDP